LSKKQQLQTLEERKADVLIKLRGYKLIKKQKHDDAIGYIIEIPKEKQKALVWAVPGRPPLASTVSTASQKP